MAEDHRPPPADPGMAQRRPQGVSWAASPGVRRSMQGNRPRDTAPELAVRRELHGRGLRYRVNRRPVPTLRRTADILFPTERVAVLIDGCFWHGCPEHFTVSKTNAAYWADKVAATRRRDEETTRRWEAEGWLVERYWTHEPVVVVAARIEAVVRAQRAGAAPP